MPESDKAVIEVTWDEKRLARDRLVRLRQVMREKNVGALLLSDWLSGRYALNLRVPQGEAFVPVEGDPIYFVRPMDAGYVEKANVKTREYLYEHNPSDPGGARQTDWADSLAELMKDYGLEGERLAADHMDPESVIALYERGLRLCNAKEILQGAASVKTQDEVLIYWQLGKLYSSIMRLFQAELEPGMSEREMVKKVSSHVSELGGETLRQINVCSGENSWPWRRWATDRRFNDGDLVGMDLHVAGAGGYIFDASRTYLCGSTFSDKQKELYHRAVEYNNTCIEMLRPGVPIPGWVENLPKVPAKFEPAVYTFHIAHSNGLTPGEYPNVVKQRPAVDDTFRENQVLSLDCYFGEDGYHEAVKLEELVLIKSTGAVKMADMPYDDRLLR